MIEARVIEDSVHAKSGGRLTTFVLTYPRFIHSEFMTHRMFSRNASSSRAIPVKKQIQAVIDNPAIPMAFLKNKPGMQGGEPLNEEENRVSQEAWLTARDHAVRMARVLVDLEVHKQYANRILEPWAYITVVCSATDFNNFFALRIHPAAMPEICELAQQMYRASLLSVPKTLDYGEWHLPFITREERAAARPEDWNTLVRRSAARCARVSYLNHEGKVPTRDEDLALYDRLVGSQPIHASPTEHQATPDHPFTYRGNFYGWKQWRKFLPNENVQSFKPKDENP